MVGICSGYSPGILWSPYRNTSAHEDSQRIPRGYPENTQRIPSEYPEKTGKYTRGGIVDVHI
jgi:hypothetical protein